MNADLPGDGDREFSSAAAFAQAPPSVPVAAAAKTLPEGDKAWSFTASAYTYLGPDDREYVQPTFTADRNGLQYEARYNNQSVRHGVGMDRL